MLLASVCLPKLNDLWSIKYFDSHMIGLNASCDQMNIPIFKTLHIAKNIWRIMHTIHVASMWLWKNAWIFVLEHNLFLKAHSFPQATLSKNFLFLEIDNVHRQISDHIFVPNGGYICLYLCYVFFLFFLFFQFHQFSPSLQWIKPFPRDTQPGFHAQLQETHFLWSNGSSHRTLSAMTCTSVF